jgi:hypothetical protein
VPSDGDARRLLSEVRTLAHRVRLDQLMIGAAGFTIAHRREQ